VKDSYLTWINETGHLIFAQWAKFCWFSSTECS